MYPDRGEYDEFAENEDDEDASELADSFESTKEQSVFLIDASESMFKPFAQLADTENGQAQSHSYFSYAMRTIKTHMKTKIFANPDDEIAVLFYGTKIAENASNFDNVFTLLKLDFTDASRIRQVEEMTDEDFKEKIGSMADVPGPLQMEALRMGLWAAGQMFTTKSKVQKRVFLMTANDDPCRGAPVSRSSLLVRAETLRDAQVALQFLPLPTPGQLFDMGLAWQELLQASREKESDSQEEVASEYTYLQEIAKLESFTSEVMQECMASMDTIVRKKGYKRRAAARLRWSLVDGRVIAVQVYNLVQPCPVPSHTYVHSKNLTMLRRERRLIASHNGAMLTEQDQITLFQPGAKVSEDLFPKSVHMGREVVAAVKAVAEPGLHLMGFKPRAYLRDYHQAGKSSFLRPNDGDVRGSVTAFKALLDAMVREDKVAICRYRRGKSSDTRMVALLPQLEVKDSFNVQIFPEGMHLLQMPFMDDIRCPEKATSVVGTKIFRADRDQVDKAAALIQALSFPKDEHTGVSTFACDQVPNPFLQRVYLSIECRAMGEEIPVMEPDGESSDHTKPDFDAIERKHELIQDYMDAVYGMDATPDGSKGTKRKSAPADASQATGGFAVAEAYPNFDWQDLAGRPGSLEKLTIKDLKVYLAFNRLPVSGKKDELCARIREHMSR